MQRVILLLSIGSFTNLLLIAFGRWGVAGRLSQAAGLQGYADSFVSALSGNVFFGCILGQFGALSVWLAFGMNALSSRLLWGCFLFCHIWMFYVIAWGPLDWEPVETARLVGRGCTWFLGTLCVVALLTYPMRRNATRMTSSETRNPAPRFRRFSTAQLFGVTLVIAILFGVARTIYTTKLSPQLVYDVAVSLGSGLASVSAIYSFHFVTSWLSRASLAAVAGLCCGFMVEAPMGTDLVNLLLTCAAYATTSLVVMIAASAFDWPGYEAGASVVESHEDTTELSG